MIDYKQILLKQNIMKSRIEQQINNVVWSAPFIILDDVLENTDTFKWDNLIFKKDDKGIFYIKDQYKMRITEYNPYWKHTKYRLYNLPFHFGIRPQKKASYFLDVELQSHPIWNEKEFPTTVIYKNSKKEIGTGLTEQDYIYFTHFANKNYLTYRSKEDPNQIIFKYDLFYEDKEVKEEDAFKNKGPYFIDRYTNPSYTYQGSPDKFNKILLLDIYNSSCKIETIVKVNTEGQEEEKKKILYPCFFEGMPLQEQEFLKTAENTFKPIIGETKRGVINMYYTETNKSTREDYIEYFVDQNPNIQLRLY